MLASPAAAAGIRAEIRVPSGNAATTGAACPPICTVEPLKFVPITSSKPPPLAGPVVALMRLIVGALALMVRAAVEDMPLNLPVIVDEPAEPAVRSPVAFTVAALVLLDE